jgi:hypothetical protein
MANHPGSRGDDGHTRSSGSATTILGSPRFQPAARFPTSSATLRCYASSHASIPVVTGQRPPGMADRLSRLSSERHDPGDPASVVLHLLPLGGMAEDRGGCGMEAVSFSVGRGRGRAGLYRAPWRRERNASYGIWRRLPGTAGAAVNSYARVIRTWCDIGLMHLPRRPPAPPQHPSTRSGRVNSQLLFHSGQGSRRICRAASVFSILVSSCGRARRPS